MFGDMKQLSLKMIKSLRPHLQAYRKEFSFFIRRFLKLLPLQGARLTPTNPGRCPGLRASAPSGRAAYYTTVQVDKIPSYLLLYQLFESFLTQALQQGGFIPAQKTAALLLA